MVIHAPQRTRTGKSLFGRETKGSRWGGSCDVEWVPGHLFSLFWEGDLPQALLVPFLTLFQQHKRRLYTWTSPDSQYQYQIDYILCTQRWRSSIQLVKRPGADCGSDYELLIVKFRPKLKKVGKTTTPFRYDLHTANPLRLYSGSDKQIQGIRSDRQSAWRIMDRGSWHYTGGRDQDHPQGKEMQKGKMVVGGGLTNSWERKRS